VKDDEISVISSEERKKLYSNYRKDRKQSGRKEWHSDITFEPIPSDYTLLRLTELPKTGGGEIHLYFFPVPNDLSKLTKF
jgi:alpha-ketoglutarate-dependent taurine dioxygenase